MPTDQQLFPQIINGAFTAVEIVFIIFAFLFLIFSLIILRQVFMMTDTIKTEGRGLLRFLSVLYTVTLITVIIFLVANL